MAATHSRTGEVDLRVAAQRLALKMINPVAFLEAGDPDWQIIDDAITELIRLRAIETAAREVLVTWDRVLPVGVGIEFYSTVIGLREALAGA